MDSNKVRIMINRLHKMQTKTPDGLGAYLGDGMPHTPDVPIRSQSLANLLEELLQLRRQDPFKKTKDFLEELCESLDDGIALAMSYDSESSQALAGTFKVQRSFVDGLLRKLGYRSPN
jgi:hypothetical protein